MDAVIQIQFCSCQTSYRNVQLRLNLSCSKNMYALISDWSVLFVSYWIYILNV